MQKIKAFFVKLFKNKRAASVIAVTLAVALIASALLIYYLTRPSDTDPTGGVKEPPKLISVFGVLFDGSNTTPPIPYEGIRPPENANIPYANTKLSRIFNSVDKHYLYIKSRCYTLGSTGFIEQVLTYAIDSSDIYICQQVGYEKNHFISKSDGFFGIDFEQMQYTEISSVPYTVDELLAINSFDVCTAMGKDLFFGEELDFEDFSIPNSEAEWIRYYFDDAGMLAGYARYNGDRLDELMYYEEFTSVFPDDVTLYFEIPAGFEKYDNIVDWSDIFGDDVGIFD